MSNSKSRGVVQWVAMGIRFGYPPCCIGDFVERVLTGQRIDEKRKLHGSGYVPCPECNKKTDAELLAAIRDRRKFEKPFPEDGMEALYGRAEILR